MTAIELGCPYSIYGSKSGLLATLNNPSDPNFVGYVKDITGLDMAGVREKAGVKTAGDGGYHGPFWRDRRPWTISGFIMPTTPIASRDAAQDKLIAAVASCFRADGYLVWTPLSDNIQRYIPFRVQQPCRITPGQSNQQKTFLVAGVAADWRVLALNQSTIGPVAGSALPLVVTPFGVGDADAAPVIKVTGPINRPVITEVDSGKKFTFTGNVPAGQQLVIDLTGQYPSVLLNGSDWSNNVDPLNTNYTIAVQSGSHPWHLSSGSGTTGATSATALEVDWRDSWH